MANTDFSVLLKAVLDKSGINTELKQVQEIVKKYHMEVTPDLQTKSLRNQFRSVCQEMANDFNKAFGTNITGNDMFKIYENKAKQLEQTLQRVNKIQLLSNGGVKNDYSTQIAKLQGNFRSLGLTEDEVSKKTSNVTTALDNLRSKFSQPINESNYQEILTLNDALQRELSESANEYTKLQASAKGFVSEQQRLALANTIEAWNQKNSAATKEVREQNEKYIASLRELDTQMDRMSFNNIKNGFKQAENSMRGLGKLGANVRKQFQMAVSSFTTWLSASTVVMAVISKTRQALTELKEMDTLLTEISKTNDSLSSSQLSEIGDNAFETASKYGKKATNYLEAVKEMSRAGYDNVEAMGELSTAAQGAGDMTADVANSFIVATDKAYQMDGSVEKLTKTLDGINNITNHNAVNMTELSEGFSVVASTASSFGVEANQLTAALGTMAATTQQSGSEVARAFRAILLNIRQVSDEEENIDAEGLTKYEKACNALGVSLKETVNGVLQTRDAMDVLEDLSKAYVELDENDLRRTDLLNSLGGKLRSTQLDALLTHWSDYESMLQQYEDGMGSMSREAEKTANSWEGTWNKVSNTFTDTVDNIANSKAVIGLGNMLNGLLVGVNKLTGALGSLGTIGLGAGLFAGINNKNFGRPKMFGLCFEIAENHKCSLGY